MGSIRKMKRENVKSFPSINLKAAYELGFQQGKADGYKEGAAEQRQLDIQSITNLLNDLEEMPGIGVITANKIRVLFMSKLEGVNKI